MLKVVDVTDILLSHMTKALQRARQIRQGVKCSSEPQTGLILLAATVIISCDETLMMQLPYI